MSIFTIGNKPINFKTTYIDNYYQEWLADRTAYYGFIDSLQECSNRYLCFTCDFITDLGSSSVLNSRLFWVYVVDGEKRNEGTSLLFGKSSDELYPSFNNITIPDVDLTVKNNIKYVFDLDGGELFFFLNGSFIGSYSPFSYIREIFTNYHTHPAYIRPVYGNGNNTHVTTSNAKVFHCDTFDQAKKWTGIDGGVGTSCHFAVNGG